MSPLLAIGLFFGLSVVASVMFIICEFAYSRGWGDGFNHAQDRHNRTDATLYELERLWEAS